MIIICQQDSTDQAYLKGDLTNCEFPKPKNGFKLLHFRVANNITSRQVTHTFDIPLLRLLYCY